FFFSSRRRHTRFSRDWSSDVCSSDLALEAVHGFDVVEQERQVEDLQLLGVVLELGQGRGDDVDVAQQQGFHFLAVTVEGGVRVDLDLHLARDRKSTRLNSSHVKISYAVFCLK